MKKLEINGKAYNADVPDDMPLLWVLRDELGLKGTKFGCGVAQCGACTVHVDDTPVRSCVTSISDVAGTKITTIEGVAASRIGKALHDAWLDVDVMQCGYCQAGQIMSAAAFLAASPQPSDSQIDDAMEGNLCRCATYLRVRQAIKLAAAGLKVAERKRT